MELAPSSPTLWKRNRIAILEAANYKCANCGQNTKLVHHKDGKRIDHRMENLTPLCHECHVKLHYEMGSITHTVFNNQYTANYTGKPQVSLNTRITVEIAIWLDEYSKASGKSKASIVQEALEALKKQVNSK